MFSFVRLSDGGASPPAGEIKSEVELICGLAARLLPPGPFPFERMTSHRAIREAMARVVPGYGEIGTIDAGGGEFQVPGRTMHSPRFETPSGRVRVTVPPLPDFVAGDGEFRLMTLRSEGQFNTVVYEDEDLYRGNTRRDVVMMHAADAERLGCREGDAITVENSTGSLRVVVAFAELPPGNLAMYYPEANILVPRRLDRASGTPAFKSVIVRLRR
jgi:anaerobic selenocysteine-containing dehydrogenase